ncbi:dihydropteroate synthase [Aeromicrobium camelliae]|uniref:Dihydropteroate synthase n=1 Tax=Aeromicrobium camelliae TaxID=1538144 RepID=A0A3N6X832_9ACTN|nr:dihydropteroate synthase [Aeromicrobium camelliae]RQN09813.1 dihydropteroate synthase [Aeromicrobium camelliae]
MGVVNVTPDSFSDGGRWFDTDTAIAHGLALVARGADLVDVGGESTRPGAVRVDPEEEQRRVLPVITELARRGVVVSVDTMNAETAERALDAGARILNDVSGGRADPRMTAVAADAGVPFVVMHWRAHSAQMQQHTEYDDVVADVLDELQQQIDDAVAAGIDPANIITDPGLGFSKTGAQNWELLAQLDAFHALGFPVLVAASRKRFLGELLAAHGSLRPTDEREDATAAISTLSALADAWAVRVHEPRPSADAVRVVARMREAGA